MATVRSASRVAVGTLLAISLALCWVARPTIALADPPANESALTFFQRLRLAQRTTLWNRAQKSKSAGKWAEAGAAFEQVLVIERNVLGEANDDVGSTLEMLADVKASAEDFPGARQYRQQALDVQLKLHPADDWRVTDARLALESTNQLEHLTPADRQGLREADEIFTEISKHYGQQAYARAIPLATQALSARKSVLGERCRICADSFDWLALLYRSTGDYARAEPLYRQALEIRKEILGEKHPDYATSLNNLGLLYVATGDYARAEPLYRQALEIRKEILGEKHPDYTTSLNNLGALYDWQGDYARAEPLYRQALEIRKQVLGEKHPDYAFSLSNLSGLYVAMGDYARAEPLQCQAIAIRKVALGEKHPDYATSLNNLGLLYVATGDYARAEPLYRQALEIRKQVLGEKHPDYTTSLNNLGALYDWQSDYARAEPLYRQALEIRKQVLGEKHPDYATSLSNLGGLYVSKSDYGKAEPLYRQALEIRKEILGEKHPDYATSLTDLGGLYDWMDEYDKAEPLYREALEIRKEVLGEKHPAYATSLSNLGGLYVLTGDYARAEPLYRQALEIRKEVLGEKHPAYATSLSNLGWLYVSKGDYGKAEPLCRQALEIRKEVLGEKHPAYATSLHNLGWLYYLMGDYAGAEPLYRQALEIRGRVLGEKHPNFAQTLNNLALLYADKGENWRALPLYTQSLEIRKEVLGEKHPAYAQSLSNLALVWQARHDYSRAEPLFRQALEIKRQALGEKHPDYALGLNNLGWFYRSTGDYVQAEQFYQQSLKIRREVLGEKHPHYAQSLDNLADLYSLMGDDARAEPMTDSAVRIRLESLEQTADAQSTQQQLVMLGEARYTLDRLISIAERTGNHSLAWEQVLAWKGSVAARQRALHALADRPDLQPLWAELQKITGQLARQSRATASPDQAAAWRRQVAALSAQQDALERELAEKSAAYRQTKQPIGIERLRDSLPPNAVLVDYLEYSHSEPPPKDQPGTPDYEQRLVAFVMKREGAIERFELGPVELLDETIDLWRETWGTSSEGSAAAATLREKLWAPLEPSLAGAKLVFVSPDGALGKLPLTALPGKDLARYLLEDFPLVMLGAPRELVWLQAEPPERKRAGNLLILGDVDYQSRDQSKSDTQSTKDFDKLAKHGGTPAPRGTRDGLVFTPLPGTKGELATIGKLYQQTFGSQGMTALEKQGATTLALCEAAPSYTYLHLATHGFFAPPEIRSALERRTDEQPEQSEWIVVPQSLSGFRPNLLSGLALAGANHPDADDDGIVTAEDVEALDLSGAQLVVLSACETGLGQSAGGEGLLGLQRAFAAAGARTVVGSLWKVDDGITRDLMERFYANLWEKEMGKLEALREAQLWVLDQRGSRGLDLPQKDAVRRLHPKYWAAFVLSGDWR